MATSLLEVVRSFSRAMLGPYDLQELLQRLSEQTVELMDADGAGILLTNRAGDLRFAAATNDAVEEAERHQARSETGACYEAFETNEFVVVDDLTTVDRWPGYQEAMEELGLHAVLGVPLRAGDRAIGALNIYRGSATAWTEEDVEVAEVLGTIGAAYIVNAGARTSDRTLIDQLQSALDSRGVIEQAKGMLMARDGLDADSAFESLRTASQKTNRKLRDLAREMVGEGDT